MPEDIVASSTTSLLDSMGLNEQQTFAVTCPDSDILVLAGAGTGKTKTIVARVAHLVRSGAAPERILMMTFTRRAAREMQTRIEGLVGKENSGKITAGTFHHFCLHAMRKAPKLFCFEKSTVIDQDDAENLFKLSREDVSEKVKSFPKSFPTAKDLMSYYSYARNTGRVVREYLEKFTTLEERQIDLALKVFSLYESFKKQYGYLDFDDILCLFARMIHESPEASRFAKGLYDHILVDEMQDTNPVQWKILEGMRQPGHLFCVGDDAQSIYSFRGADFRNVHSFRDRIPGGTVLKLETNYRSTQEILDVSNWLIRESPLNYGKQLRAERGSGLKPQFLDFAGELDEAKWIVDDVAKTIGDGTKFKDIMIMTRTAWRSRGVEAELIAEKIPYVFIGGMSITRAAHVKDVFSLLRASISNTDRLAWLRYLMLWKGIGEKWASKAFASVSNASNIDTALEALPNSIPRSAKELGIAENVRDARRYHKIPTSALAFARERLEPCLKDSYDNWELRKKDLLLLEKIAERFDDIESFLETYTLDPLTPTQIGSQEDSLTLITVHSAKGTEAKVCYVIGAEPGQFPHSRSLKSEDDIEEERRILYVAMTRAKDRLVLTRGLTYDMSDRYFLNDLPESLYESNETSEIAETTGAPTFIRINFGSLLRDRTDTIGNPVAFPVPKVQPENPPSIWRRLVRFLTGDDPL